MEDRLKKLAKSVSETGSPVEVFLDDVSVDLGDGSSVDVQGTLSITPGNGGVEKAIEELGDGYEVRSGGVKLHCSDKETCRVELVEENKVVMDVRRASLFKDFLQSMRGDGDGDDEGNPLASLAEKGFTLKVKYKGMTLLRNADPESLLSFVKKL